MRVAIVVPYSWSFWGGVVEHATEQAAALEQLGVETRILIGHDPPGAFSRTLHPRSGRADRLPANVVPLGHSVIVPGNGSLPNLVLNPLAIARLRAHLLREQYDVVHVHEPLTPALGIGALAWSQAPIVATFHAAGDSSWRPAATALWGFLLDRIDHHIAVSGPARDVAAGYHPAEYEILPNGIRVPAQPTETARNNHVAFVGRHEPRKGLPVLLQAWPAIRAQTGLTLRIIGADPLAVSLLIRRLRIDDNGIELIGLVSDENLSRELASAQLLIAPSLGGESFGMVITRAFACATPVVASDIDGYRELVTPNVGFLTPPGDPVALARTVITALDEPGRLREAGQTARDIALTRYRWDTIARRLVEIYGTLVDGKPTNQGIGSPTVTPAERQTSAHLPIGDTRSTESSNSVTNHPGSAHRGRFGGPPFAAAVACVAVCALATAGCGGKSSASIPQVQQSTKPTAPVCRYRAGWQRLANRIHAAVYCPGWLPDPLTDQIGGTSNNVNAVSADRSYLESFIWQDLDGGGLGGVLHVIVRGYPGRTAIPTCTTGGADSQTVPCFAQSRQHIHANGIDSTLYTVNQGMDNWHLALLWRRDGSLYTLSEHLAPPLNYNKVIVYLKHELQSLILVQPANHNRRT